MLENYEKFPEKRFVVGVINESARAVSNLIKGILIRENKLTNDFSQNILSFQKIAKKYFAPDIFENLIKIIEIQKDSSLSLVEFRKGEKIIFLVDGKYKILTVSRLNILVHSVKIAFFDLPSERQL